MRNQYTRFQLIHWACARISFEWQNFCVQCIKSNIFFLDNGTHAYTESIYANSFRWINSMSWRLLLCCVYESNLLTLVGYLTRVPFIIIWCFAFIKVHKYISNFRNWKWAINTRRQQINSNLSPECIVDYKRDFFPHFIDAFFYCCCWLREYIKIVMVRMKKRCDFTSHTQV